MGIWLQPGHQFIYEGGGQEFKPCVHSRAKQTAPAQPKPFQTHGGAGNPTPLRAWGSPLGWDFTPFPNVTLSLLFRSLFSRIYEMWDDKPGAIMLWGFFCPELTRGNALHARCGGAFPEQAYFPQEKENLSCVSLRWKIQRGWEGTEKSINQTGKKREKKQDFPFLGKKKKSKNENRNELRGGQRSPSRICL